MGEETESDVFALYKMTGNVFTRPLNAYVKCVCVS